MEFFWFVGFWFYSDLFGFLLVLIFMIFIGSVLFWCLLAFGFTVMVFWLLVF